ncbi:MAG TPA: VOC family protein [Pyrinomonadaceae bacterium]|nr:VOC family protein [Pyrinomonadaceae bacterium]
MSEHKIPAAGSFCWNELATKDLDAARRFYTELLGWQLRRSDAAGVDYHEIVAGGEHVGGLYQMGPECGGDMPSHWMAYVAVEDVDERAARVEGLGGKVCVPPTDIPNVGRFCVVTDPSGATLSLITMKGAAS